MKKILNKSYVLFVQDVVNAIKEGYYVVNSNAGWVGTSFLYDINLFKLTEAPTFNLIDDNRHTIQEYDAQKFLNKLQEAILSGFVVDIDTLYWDNVGLKSVQCFNPNHPKNIKYTKEQLDELSWEEIKDIAKLYNKTGRDRSLLVNHILKSQEEE